MKIAMFTNNYKPYIGGVPVSIERLVNGLRKRGHIVDVFAPTCEEQKNEEGVYRFKSLNKKLDGDIVVPNMFDRDIRKQFQKRNYDIIHSHHPMLMGNIALSYSKKYEIPLIYTYHTRYEEYMHYVMPSLLNKNKDETKIYKVAEQIVSKYTRSFSNKCNLIFAPTPEIKKIMIQNRINTPITVVPTGLSENDFIRDKEKTEEIRKKFNSPNLFCCVSRLGREKNFPFMLKALKTLKERWGKSFKMIIIGDGAERKSLSLLSKKLGLEENVHFLGNIEHEKLVHYYNACDLFLFSSQSETQGIVLLEAMAAGLPVVAVSGSGVNDVVVNGENGFKTELNEELWIKPIEEIMENSYLFKSLKIGAYNTAKEYTAESIAKLTEENYLQLIQGKVKYVVP